MTTGYFWGRLGLTSLKSKIDKNRKLQTMASNAWITKSFVPVTLAIQTLLASTDPRLSIKLCRNYEMLLAYSDALVIHMDVLLAPCDILVKIGPWFDNGNAAMERRPAKGNGVQSGYSFRTSQAAAARGAYEEWRSLGNKAREHDAKPIYPVGLKDVLLQDNRRDWSRASLKKALTTANPRLASQGKGRSLTEDELISLWHDNDNNSKRLASELIGINDSDKAIEVCKRTHQKGTLTDVDDPASRSIVLRCIKTAEIRHITELGVAKAINDNVKIAFICVEKISWSGSTTTITFPTAAMTFVSFVSIFSWIKTLPGQLVLTKEYLTNLPTCCRIVGFILTSYGFTKWGTKGSIFKTLEEMKCKPIDAHKTSMYPYYTDILFADMDGVLDFLNKGPSYYYTDACPMPTRTSAKRCSHCNLRGHLRCKITSKPRYCGMCMTCQHPQPNECMCSSRVSVTLGSH